MDIVFSEYTKIVFNGSDEIWLSSGEDLYGGLALCYHIATKQWEEFSLEKGGVREITLQGISLSPTGKIWVAGFWGVLAIYLPDGSWSRLVEVAESWDTVGFEEVFFQPGGEAWITTHDFCGFEWPCIDGLVYYDGARWVRLTADNSGLIHNEVYDIAFDAAGNVWLATAAGLQRATAP